MWINYNPNPKNRKVDDCAVRALSKALNISWDKAFSMLASEAFIQADMPHSNAVWGAVLRKNGFKRQIVPDTCPDCYTLKDFLEDHKKGTYVIAMQDHVVCASDGNAFDTWDCLDKIPQYYWYKE